MAPQSSTLFDSKKNAQIGLSNSLNLGIYCNLLMVKPNPPNVNYIGHTKAGSSSSLFPNKFLYTNSYKNIESYVYNNNINQ